MPVHLIRPTDVGKWDRARDPLGSGFASESLYRTPERGPRVAERQLLRPVLGRRRSGAL